MPINTSFRVNGASLVTDAFVETGFYRGATAVCAHYAGFKNVASIELDDDLYRRGLELPLVAEGKIKLYHGDSPDVLPEVLNPALKTVVYLDAHFCGMGDARRERECPLLDELRAVFDVPWDEMPAVVVDDAHMLRRPWGDDLRARFDERQWPALDAVKSYFPSGYAFVEDLYVLYALPAR